jgi:hypothetical protein
MFPAPGVVLINPKFPHNVGGTIRVFVLRHRIARMDGAAR